MELFETFFNNDSQYARKGSSAPMLNQANSISTITRPPRAGFKGNAGYGAPDELELKWPTFKKKRRIKVRSSSRAS